MASPSETDAMLAATLLNIRSCRVKSSGQMLFPVRTSRQSLERTTGTNDDQSRIDIAIVAEKGRVPVHVSGTSKDMTVLIDSSGAMMNSGIPRRSPATQPSNTSSIGANPPATISNGNIIIQQPHFANAIPLREGELRNRSAFQVSGFGIQHVAALEHDNIRQDEIVAALQSQPQRGRKRCNLSEAERVALTRTRNREHAKSTRNRKKARYQELEDKEATLHRLQQDRELEAQRRQAARDFLRVRDTMLQSCCGNSLDQSQVSVSALEEVIDNATTFTFTCDEMHDEPLNRGIEVAKELDAFFVRLGSDRFEGNCGKLSYKMSRDEIGLSLNDSAFVEVDIVRHVNPSQKLLSGLLVLAFTTKSSKIRAAHWHTYAQHFDDGAEKLSGQVSHPSVVSLDMQHVDRKKPSETDPGLDMNL